MTSELPVVSGREAIRVFEQVGYTVVRQRGSHIRLRHATDPSRKPLTIPDHRTLKPGLLRHLMRDAQVDLRTSGDCSVGSAELSRMSLDGPILLCPKLCPRPPSPGPISPNASQASKGKPLGKSATYRGASICSPA
jgi:predicted RNA binding protein YcfA (HicA-like mRNA interferase family)